MKRGWLTIAAVVSLVMAGVVLVDWVGQRWGQHMVMYVNAAEEGLDWVYSVHSGGGVVALSVDTVRSRATTGVSGYWGPAGARHELAGTWMERMGFGVVSVKGDMVSVGPESGGREVFSVDSVIVPSWFLVGVLLVLPVVWWRTFRKQYPAGHCRNCGYDLRASGERCPECGAIAVRSVDSATNANG